MHGGNFARMLRVGEATDRHFHLAAPWACDGTIEVNAEFQARTSVPKGAQTRSFVSHSQAKERRERRRPTDNRKISLPSLIDKDPPWTPDAQV